VHLLFSIRCIPEKIEGGVWWVVYTFLSLWILKRTRELLITNPMKPFEVYTTTLSLYTLYVTGHNLKPLSWGLWRACHPQRHNFQPFNDVNEIAISSFDQMCFWKSFAWEEGYLPSNHFWLLKRELALSIFNRKSSFWSFYNNEWPSQDFYQMHFGKIWG